MNAFTISQESLVESGVSLDSNMARWIKVAPAMMSSIDVNGRLIAVSDVWLRQLGYTRDEVIGRLTTDFMTAESRRVALTEVLPEFFRCGRCEDVEYQMVCKDGRIIDVLLSATLARSAAEQGYSSLAIIVDVTAAKYAEQRRIDSERLYRGLVEDQLELVSLISPQGELRYVNQAYARNYGRQPEDMIGASLFDFIPAHARTSVENHLRKVCAVTHPVEFESQVVSPSGDKRWVAWSNRALRDNVGDVTAIHSVGRDIQRRVAAEQRIVEGETRYRLYRLLAENSNDMKLLVGADGELIFVSRACAAILGYQPDEIIQRGPLDLIHPEDEPKVREHLAHSREQRDTLVYRMRRKDGRYVWVESHVRAIVIDAEQPSMRLVVVRDVEERISAEKQVRESEARFRLLAENTSDTIVFRPAATEPITYVSPSIRTLLGYDPKEFAQLALSEFVHPEDIAALTACYASLCRDVKGAVNVHRALHKNGGWIWVEIALAFVDGASEAVFGIIGALRDVSQRQRQAEALQQARDAAENASRIKADFLANMSHELRTPLAGILGVHDILHADGTLNERQRRLVKLAEQSGRMLLNVVNDILDYSKMEAGKLELKSVRFSIADLIGSSVSIIAGLAAAKQLDVQVSSDESIPTYLVGDEDRLRQILLNFLNNAVKFTRAGHVALKVERLSASNDAERLRFSVSDTGIGIAKDKIDRLFQRFSQVDGSTSREYGGSGLGLAIVKRLVDLMEGELGVESTAEKGSTFWFVVKLPVAEHEAASRAIASAVEPRARSARILVAEDIEVNQVIVRGMLESAGHKVEMVSNGGDAILAASTKEYDIILMDIQMPGIDGVLATKRIRALPGPASRLPIVAMTADVLAPKVAQFLATGMDDHIGKPFSREELLAALARHLPPAGASEISAATDHEVADAQGKFMDFDVGGARKPTVDDLILERLVKIVGRQTVDSLLGKLAVQLEGRFADGADGARDLAKLAKEAHKLASSAGMLGFAVLSQRCANLESALSADKDVSAPLGMAREACIEALTEISSRLHAPTPVAASA